MSAHTPGPWHTDGKVIRAEPTEIFPEGAKLATVHLGPVTDEQYRANAQLIGAAPAMYEALYRIAYLPFGASEATHAEVLEAVTQLAREIIAKVRP